MNDFLRTAKRYRVLISVAAIVLVLGAIYVSGYRLGPGLTIARLGAVELDNIPQGSQVFVDYGLRGTSAGTSFTAAVMPGTHSIIVNAPDAYPWEEIAAVGASRLDVLAPVIVRKAVLRLPLSGDAAKAAKAAIASTTLPTAAAPLPMGCAKVYVDANRVMADAATTTPGCGELPYACTGGTCAPTIVYAPAAAVTAVLPYPGNDAALVIAVGDHLYALEIDPRTPQFFAPLVDGINLKAGVETGGRIVILDDERAYALGL
jgi:hypothetical protein